ncbi:MAG: endosialidase [Lachnospiraceae bacterium]|nr:endosialidase [Lachnospiraceae bacterium]
MAVVSELIRTEQDGSLSFGDYTLTSKTKKADFEHDGDIYKIKTFNEITRLERNEALVYESSPGTAVHNLKTADGEISFSVEGPEDAMVTLELEADSAYEIVKNGTDAGEVKTNLGGKLPISVELGEGANVSIKVTKK